jgi:hypothetical protein
LKYPPELALAEEGPIQLTACWPHNACKVHHHFAALQIVQLLRQLMKYYYINSLSHGATLDRGTNLAVTAADHITLMVAAVNSLAPPLDFTAYIRCQT